MCSAVTWWWRHLSSLSKRNKMTLFLQNFFETTSQITTLWGVKMLFRIFLGPHERRWSDCHSVTIIQFFLYLNSRARSIRSLKKLAMDIGKCRVDTQRIQWWSWCVQSNRKIEQREWHNESAAPPMPPRLSLFFFWQTKRSPHSSNFFFTDNVHAIVIALFRSRLFRVCQMKNRKKKWIGQTEKCSPSPRKEEDVQI